MVYIYDMSSIIKDETTGGKFLVKSADGQWYFDDLIQAQRKANEEMWKEYEKKYGSASVGATAHS